MNAVTQTPRRPGWRSAERDPCAAEAQLEGRADYGCVDWYVYGEAEPAADARRPPAQPAGAPPEPQARAQPH